MSKTENKEVAIHVVVPRFEAKRIEASSELLQFLRKSKEIEENFLIEHGLYHKYDNVNDFISDEIKNRIEVLQDLGFTQEEVEKSFKAKDLF